MDDFGLWRQLLAGRRGCRDNGWQENFQDHCATKHGNNAQASAVACGLNTEKGQIRRILTKNISPGLKAPLILRQLRHD